MLRKFYRPTDLGQIFLLIVFPTHLWALYRVFMNGDWIAARESAWEVAGLGSYSLLFVLVETVLLWGLFILLGFLLPARWEHAKRNNALSTIFLAASIWALLGQVYFLLPIEDNDLLYRIFYNVNRFGAVLLPLTILVIIATVAVPILLANRSPKFNAFMTEAISRISLLSGLYLLLDFFALVIVIMRNL